jgi:mycothiol synthase
MHGPMHSVPLPDIQWGATLSTPATVAQVRDLHRRAAAADEVAPLSEQTLLSLDAAPDIGVEHLTAYAAQGLVGYAQVQPGGGDDAPSVELVVDPAVRRQGVGGALLEAVLSKHPSARVWAHGNLPAARALAAGAGLEVVRELHKMARPLAAGDASPDLAPLPPGFHAGPFVPGRDEEAWLRVNAAAFAHHPEQGRLTLADLRERMAQPWFDPAGLVMVTADDVPPGAADSVAAFHWTKVDPGQTSSTDPTRPAGEVYVVAVDPAYQGRGLGRPVTALGLAHLARLGLPEVVLYVDGDNHAAIRTYTTLGFRSMMVDVMYSRLVHRPLSG